MLKIRKVSEDRIKTLQVFEYLRWDNSSYPEEAMREIICRRMGHELARKLFEFQKVREVDREDGVKCFIARLDVIIPKGKPEMPKIAGDPLTKVTLNLYEADIYWLQEEYGQGWSTRLRDIVHRHVTTTKQVRMPPFRPFCFGTGEFDE